MSLQLYSIPVCPFAQRTRIVLEKKGVACEVTQLPLRNPLPDWFIALNPLGQVPVLVHDGKALNESSYINEYLEEVFPDPRLFPADPYCRAQTRILIDYCNHSFVPAMYELLMNQDAAEDRRLIDKALATWRWVDAFLVRFSSGGDFLWDCFGMAELTFGPFFQRYVLNEYYRGFDVPGDKAYARVRRWRDAILSDAAVIATGMSDEEYIKLYEDYALGYGNGAVPPGRERSSFDLTIPLQDRPWPPRRAGRHES